MAVASPAFVPQGKSMSWITRPGWLGNLLALVAGTLTTLALAPFDLWPLALVSIALLFLGLRELAPGQAARRGWCYGFGLFASGVSWVYVSIHDFGAASPALAGLLTLASSPGWRCSSCSSAGSGRAGCVDSRHPCATHLASPPCGSRWTPCVAGC